MRIINLEQSGPAWHRWRSQGIGGSEAASLMGRGFLTEDQLTEVKLGRQEVVENDRMRRGKTLEPVARRLYEELTGIRMRPVCVVHGRYSWFRASLDGISGCRAIVLEIKCPSDRAHKKALDGAPPDYYWPQVQHNLGVTGAKVLHYFSFTDAKGFAPHQQWALVACYPDEDYIARLIETERAYHQKIRRLKRKEGGGAR